MKKLSVIFAALMFFLGVSAPAMAVTDEELQALTARIQGLESELAIMKRQKEVEEEKTVAAAEKSASVEFGKKGLKIASPDKKYELSAKGYVQIDSRSFIDDDGDTGRDEIIARRIRPVIEGKAGNASFRVMPDFAGATTRIFDAHVDYKFTDAVQVRAGKFKPPIGLERLQSATDTFFMERGHPTNLAPNRDIGVQVYGSLIPDRLEYQAGVFNGTTDLGNTDNDSDDHKDIAGRILTHPFKNSDTVALRGLGIGIGGSTGEREGSVATPVLGDYRTPGQQAFFRYRSGGTAAFADGTHWRLYPQAYWYHRNFGLLGEYAISNQEVTRGAAHAELENTAWQVAGSYVLTGEDVSFKGGVRPEKDFDPAKGGWGAFETVVRAGATEIDDDAFPVFADPAVSAAKAQSFGAGLNWYLNENAKLQLNYDFTQFDGGAVAGDRPDEQALFTRAQFRLN